MPCLTRTSTTTNAMMLSAKAAAGMPPPDYGSSLQGTGQGESAIPSTDNSWNRQQLWADGKKAVVVGLVWYAIYIHHTARRGCDRVFRQEASLGRRDPNNQLFILWTHIRITHMDSHALPSAHIDSYSLLTSSHIETCQTIHTKNNINHQFPLAVVPHCDVFSRPQDLSCSVGGIGLLLLD